MVKASPFIEAMNAGEFSPRMDARVSFEKYGFAVSRALNLVAMPQGGLTLRPGTRFTNEIKTSSSRGALYSLEPQSGRGYMSEFGNGYIRFYRSQTRMVAETLSTTVTNGAFAANITNWTNRSTGAAAIAWTATSGGRLQLTAATDGYAWAEQSISVILADRSKLHIFRFSIDGNAGDTVTVQIGTASLGKELWSKAGYGIGQHTIAVTPGAATIYFQVINKGLNNLYLDNVEILTGVPLELTNTPYSAAESDDLRITQSNDVFYVFHASYAVRKLERRGDYSWSFTTAFFEDGPWGEINPEIDLGEANLVKNPSFDGGLGEDWSSSTSEGSVEYDGSQGVVFFHLTPGGNGQRAEVRQHITTGAANTVHVMHFQAVGRGKTTLKIGTTSGAADIVASTSYDPGWYSISFTPAVTSFYISFGAYESVNSTTDDIPGVGGVFMYNERHNLLTASAKTGSVTIEAAGDFFPFVSTDVGRALRLEHAGREAGWGIITAYTDSDTVTVQVYRKFASTVGTETWRLGAWSDTTGWPKLGTFYQQRLYGARTTDQPQTFWASQSGDFQNMRPDSWVEAANTTEDDDAFLYTIGSKRGSPITWFASNRKLIIGSSAGQWIAVSRGPALTPTDLSLEQHTSVRTIFAEPVEIDTVGLFIERDRNSIDDIGYNYEIDGYKSADLNILADHIGAADFQQIVFQSKPYALVWARKGDGTLALLTYKREQNVVGWTPVKIAGSSAGDAVVESLAVIPGGAVQDSQVYTSKDRDEVWMIVKRTIGGVTKRFIEVIEGFFRGPNRAEYDTRALWLTALLTAQKDAFYVDCGVTAVPSTLTVSGLTHLIGESVMAIVDGLVQGPFTVGALGTITLTTTGALAHVGLAYNWRLRGLKANYGAQSGSSVGQTKQLGTFHAVLLDSSSFSYGVEPTGEKGRDAEFEAMSAHLPTGGALYTGEVELTKPPQDWDTDPRFIFKGSDPLPFTFLGIAFKADTKEV